MQSNHDRQSSAGDADRTNRFLSSSSGADTPNTLNLRERAASQPPRTSNTQPYLASPSLQTMRTNSGGPGVWPRFSSGLNTHPSLSAGLPSSVPTRSSSFSSSNINAQGLFSNIRESRFASTFEDDESEALSDVHDPYEERYINNSQPAIGPGLGGRGRTYAADMTRSRSQSVATTRPGTISNPFGSGLWDSAGFSGSNPQNIPDSRYGDLKPAGGSSRYGSLGALGRSPSNGYSRGVGSFTDHSNMSPFVRDLQQILSDENAPGYRESWLAQRANAADETGGGGSGTTSRRHSVSVIARPRPTVVGFNAPGPDQDEPTMSRAAGFQSSFSGSSGGLLLTDDDLASDLGMLNLGYQDESTRTLNMGHSVAPSSLPSNAQASRSPTYDRLSSYQALHLNIPGGAGSFASRPGVGSPSDTAFSGGSPSRHQLESEGHLAGVRENIGVRASLTARFVPGQGIQHIPEASILPTPITPGGMRSGYSPSIQRRPSDATRSINDLGRGVPLHSVPTSWPLFIIEFKAGRTDLFYCTDLTLDIRVGDLVIVEADRGKDLGKVINDTITLAEVEAFQKQQKILSGYAEAQGQMPTSPTGAGKEINPKMIYGKASMQDTQGLAAKLQDEAKALELCRSKVRQRKLPMEVIDAEYQWDRRKLTFYFVAEKRIDFRELVRELFRLYKTRIWMASLGGAGHDQQ